MIIRGAGREAVAALGSGLERQHRQAGTIIVIVMIIVIEVIVIAIVIVIIVIVIGARRGALPRGDSSWRGGIPSSIGDFSEMFTLRFLACGLLLSQPTVHDRTTSRHATQLPAIRLLR